MSAAIKHRGKEKIKVEFNVTIVRAKNLDKALNGSTIFIEWRRGSNRISGTTRRVLVNNSTAGWDEKVTFTCTIFKNAKSDKFDEKAIKFAINEDQPKKKKVNLIGKIGLDLSQYVKSDGTELITLPIKKSTKSPPSIELMIKAEWLKYNNKVLIRTDDATKMASNNIDPNAQPTVEFGGQGYILKTDSNESDTTVDTGSVISDFDEDPIDNVDDNAEVGSTHSDEMIAPKSDRASVISTGSNSRDAAMSQQRLATIISLKKDLEYLRQQLSASKQENNDKLKALATAEQEKQELLNEIQVLRGKSDPNAVLAQEKTKQTIKKLKAENSEKDQRIMILEEEKDNLIEKLEFLKEDQQESDLKQKFLEMEQMIEEKNNTIAKHEHEIKRLKKGIRKAEDSPEPIIQNNKKEGKEEEISQIKQTLDEKIFIENNIYQCTPTFTNNISNCSSNIFRTLLSWKVFQKPCRSKLIKEISNALQITAKRSQSDEKSLGFWMSTICSLLYKLQQEQTSPSMKENLSDKDSANAFSNFHSDLSNLLFDVYSMFIRAVCEKIDYSIVQAVMESQNEKGIRRIRGIVSYLSEVLETLHETHNSETVISQTFVQIFAHINGKLFNQLLKRKDLCTVTNGFQVKLELSELEDWINSKGKQFVSNKTMDELGHIIQAATILVMGKSTLSDAETLNQIAPKLSLLQVKVILEHFTPDGLSPDPVPPFVFEQLNEKLANAKRQGKVLPETIDLDHIRPLSLPFISSKQHK